MNLQVADLYHRQQQIQNQLKDKEVNKDTDFYWGSQKVEGSDSKRSTSDVGVKRGFAASRRRYNV